MGQLFGTLLDSTTLIFFLPVMFFFSPVMTLVVLALSAIDRRVACSDVADLPQGVERCPGCGRRSRARSWFKRSTAFGR